MIVSASRRTDIPAFYSEWLMNRVREGYCLVANPFNPTQVTRVSLSPESADAIVFWSKNPAPLLPHLEELDAMGHRYYFQYTICDYPHALEPHVPPLAERIATAHQLAKRIGPRRVTWRYDPIIVSNNTDFEYHKSAFARIGSELRGATARVVVSLVDYYGKVHRNLRPLERAGWSFREYSGVEPDCRRLLRCMAQIAEEHGLEIQSCAEAVSMGDLGISPGKCIDDELMNELWGTPLQKKDPGQRGACLCATSKDIGANDTCLHGCVYCYATVSQAAAQTRRRRHDPTSQMLVGEPPADVAQSATEAQQTLF
ncbi:MAG: DUF1848 domain-containing protein [Firmicutes bacterium]|nr:DUF1848 domain-containing protein [Bacillota bacterium]